MLILTFASLSVVDRERWWVSRDSREEKEALCRSTTAEEQWGNFQSGAKGAGPKRLCFIPAGARLVGILFHRQRSSASLGPIYEVEPIVSSVVPYLR